MSLSPANFPSLSRTQPLLSRLHRLGNHAVVVRGCRLCAIRADLAMRAALAGIDLDGEA